MKLAQHRLVRLEPRELHQVAALEELPQALLLLASQMLAGPQFDKKLLSGPFRRAQVKPLFQIAPRG